MKEVFKPVGMTGSEFGAAIHHLWRQQSQAPLAVERRNKGRPGDDYVALWDEAVAEVPTDDAIRAAHTERLKARLRSRLSVAAQERRNLAAQTEDLERREAQVARALSISVKVLEGLVNHTAYNPVADGTATADDMAFMRAVRDHGEEIGRVTDAEKAIRKDIDDGKVVDTENDPRWPDTAEARQ